MWAFFWQKLVDSNRNVSIFWQKVVSSNPNVSIFWQKIVGSNPYFDLKNGLLGQCVQGMNFANKSCFWEVSIGVRNPWDSENRDKKGVSLGTLVDSRHRTPSCVSKTVSYSLKSLWRDRDSGFYTTQCLKSTINKWSFEQVIFWSNCFNKWSF